MNLEELEEGLNQGKDIRINNYVKPANRYRLSDEVVTVEITTQLESYDILKRKSLRQIKSKNITEVYEIARQNGGSKEDAKDALNELKDSLSKTSSGSGRFSSEKYKTIAPYVNYNTETGDIYFTGKKLNERKISASSYKDKNSSAKTLIKNELRHNLPNKLKVWKVNEEDLNKVEFI